MIDTVLNLLFRCPHRRLSRPVTPVGKKGESQETYVVCLDCGKHFAYDMRRMHIGKALDEPPPAAGRGELPAPAGTKLRFALWVSVPLGVLLGSILKTRGPRISRPPGSEHPQPRQNRTGPAR